MPPELIDPASRALKRVHVISKTHLDVGYTDQPDTVVSNYLDRFIPAAIALNQRLADSGRPERFIWTTGSWLIDSALELAEGKALTRLEGAIEAGTLTWHALPFTFHSELMTKQLVRASLKISSRLDSRFGRMTKSAKLTDVPGHTRSLVPLLTEAGVEFLHVGINGGIVGPDVPNLFRWVDEGSSTSIVVMSHSDYGGFNFPAGGDAAIDLKVTQDNDGPPTLLQHVERMQNLSDRFLHSEVVASTLDAFWSEISHLEPSLPILTSEIGDSWVYGGASDPQKLSRFRFLARLHSGWAEERQNDEEVEKFGQRLALVAEHTWGLDTIVHLPDLGYSNENLDHARGDGKFADFERSWARQRQYLTDAVEQLPPALKAEATTTAPSDPATDQADTRPSSRAKQNASTRLEIDPKTGELVGCFDEARAVDVVGNGSRLGLLQYQLYGNDAFSAYLDHYVKPENRNDWWVGRAFGKHKLDRPGAITQITPEVERITHEERAEGPVSTVQLAFPDSLGDSGVPRNVIVTYSYLQSESSLRLSIAWPEKRATLLPEAMWARFGNPHPDGRLLVRKLGRMVSIHDVVGSAGGTIHATDGLISIESISENSHTDLTSFDAGVFGFGDNRLLGDGGVPAQPGSDIYANLFNNLWGTNFPLWVEGAARFEFDWSVA